MNRPPEAIGMLDGLYYKIGHFDLAYWWDGADWRKSDKSSSEVKLRLELITAKRK